MTIQDPLRGISYVYATSNPIRARLLPGVQVPKKAGGNRKARQGFGCVKIDLECTKCYAATINKVYGTGLDFTRPNLEKIEFYLDEREFAKWKKVPAGSRVFVGDMLDIFLGAPEDCERHEEFLKFGGCKPGAVLPRKHDGIPFLFLTTLFFQMALNPHVNFLLLTKRPRRLAAFIEKTEAQIAEKLGIDRLFPAWPLPNVDLGVTCGHPAALHRVETLMKIPARRRWVSVEPLLGPVSFAPYAVDAIVIGGESGGEPRPFDWDWARGIIASAPEAAIWMKQGGGFRPPKTLDKFPEDLRVREWAA